MLPTKRRLQGLLGVFWVLFGVGGIGFILAATDNTSAHLSIIAMFVLFMLSGTLFILAWRRDAVTVAGRRLRRQQVNALGFLTQTAAVGVVPVSTAQDPLLGAVVLAPLVFAGGVAAYIGLTGLRLDMENQRHLAVACLFVLVLFLGAFLVVTVAV